MGTGVLCRGLAIQMETGVLFRGLVIHMELGSCAGDVYMTKNFSSLHVNILTSSGSLQSDRCKGCICFEASLEPLGMLCLCWKD